MFGLLVDFIVDERAESRENAERQRFLSDLLTQLEAVESWLAESSPAILIPRLKEIHGSADPEFAGDPVLVHLQDCIEELERIETGT